LKFSSFSKFLVDIEQLQFCFVPKKNLTLKVWGTSLFLGCWNLVNENIVKNKKSKKLCAVPKIDGRTQLIEQEVVFRTKKRKKPRTPSPG
jgi:hypothetical protein